MPTLNILHLSHSDIKYDSRILKEMSALSEYGNKYSLFGIGIALDEGRPNSVQSNLLNIDSVVLKTRSIRFLPKVVRHMFSLIELSVKMSVKAIRVKPQIVHCHDTLILPLGVFIKLATGSKLIYDAHELESDRNGLTRVLSKVTFFTEKLLWPSIDFLVIVSPSIQNWYKNNVGKKKSEVILNSPVLNLGGANIKKYDNNYLREKYEIGPSEMIFIYVGLLDKGRGIESIIEIFANLHGAHVIFMGFGEFLGLIAEREKLYTNIHLHPTVPHEDVVEIVRSADVGLCVIGRVSLSDYYCLPNKLFEYCFAGVPVIASDFPDIIDVVNKYKLGICCGQDFESIRNAIDLVISGKINMDIDLMALQELGWDTQKAKLFSVYENVMNLTISD